MPGPRCRWPTWRTRSITTGPGTTGSPRCVPPTAPRRSPGCGRWPPGSPAPGVVAPHEGPCGSGTVFVYSGQGSQWAGMGRQLLADEPAFAAAIAELEPDFVAQIGFSLHDVLAGGEPVSGIERVQPVLVGMQLALTALWRSYGVQPDAVIGHSMGEVTAAVVAGALTPAEGLRVIATRSRLMSRLAGQGAMALLELDAEATEALIADYPRGDGGGVCLAAPDGDRRAARAGRRRDRRGERRRTVRPPGEHGSRVPPRDDGSDPAGVAGGTGRSGAADTAHPGPQHRRECRCRTAVRRRALGGQRAQPGAVQPGHRRGRGPTTAPSSRSARTRC